MPLRQYLRQISTAAAFAAGLALGGCSNIDGFELNGKLFDMMGISSASQDKTQRDPKMADRPPLVVPPSVTRLPEPGSGKTTSEDVAALNDPELRKQAAAKERERLHLAYCRGEPAVAGKGARSQRRQQEPLWSLPEHSEQHHGQEQTVARQCRCWRALGGARSVFPSVARRPRLSTN